MALSALVFVVLLQRASWFQYTDSGRISLGLVQAALVAMPALVGAGLSRKLWPWVPAALWFTVVPLGLAAPHQFHVFKL
jgi:hypothetical protein